jgi:hypothetical protein
MSLVTFLKDKCYYAFVYLLYVHLLVLVMVYLLYDNANKQWLLFYLMLFIHYNVVNHFSSCTCCVC